MEECTKVVIVRIISMSISAVWMSVLTLLLFVEKVRTRVLEETFLLKYLLGFPDVIDDIIRITPTLAAAPWWSY